MSNRDEITISLYDKYIVPNYGRFPIMPVKGNGSFLYDEDDKRYIDFSGGIAVCLLYTSPSPRDKRQSRMPSSA